MSFSKNGAQIKAFIDKQSNSPDYIEIAKKIVLPKSFSAKTLYFRYHGQVAETINDVNAITPSLVELALYSGWFPYFLGLDKFNYEIKVSLPKTFIVTGNGTEIGQAFHGDQVEYTFKSIMPVNDIVILGSPLFEKSSKNSGGLQIEMFKPQNSKVDTAESLTLTMEALKVLSSLYGNAENGLLRYAYSPRAGWGYSRLPLFVVSNERAEADLQKPFVKQENIQGNIHELSHFWWQIADANTPEDWINEGLAEYSSFTFVSDKFGLELRQHLLEQYLDHAAKAKVQTPILQTKADSPVRYLNRYEKVTLLFCILEKRFGKETLFKSLHSLYGKFKGTRKATTVEFLKIIKTNMGLEAESLAKEYLATEWSRDRLAQIKKELLKKN